jgi:hypothetical protein
VGDDGDGVLGSRHDTNASRTSVWAEWAASVVCKVVWCRRARDGIRDDDRTVFMPRWVDVGRRGDAELQVDES